MIQIKLHNYEVSLCSMKNVLYGTYGNAITVNLFDICNNKITVSVG